MRDLLGKPRGFGAAPGVAQELVDVVQARPREHALVAHVFKAAHQVTKQIELQIVARREIGMPALGRKGMVAAPPVGIEPRFAQACPGGD